VADLEEKIAAVKARDEAKQARAAAKADPRRERVPRGVEGARQGRACGPRARKRSLVRAVEAAQAPLAEHLVSMVLRLPDRKAGRRRGRNAS
jgi:hypothetical protein